MRGLSPWLEDFPPSRLKPRPAEDWWSSTVTAPSGPTSTTEKYSTPRITEVKYEHAATQLLTTVSKLFLTGCLCNACVCEPHEDGQVCLYCHRYKTGPYLLQLPKTSPSLAGSLSRVCQRHVHCPCLSKWLLKLDWTAWLDGGTTRPLRGFYPPELCHLWIKCCHLSGSCLRG